MPDYQKSKIYKLWSPSKNIVYFGSTTETLARRLAKHISNYKAYNKGSTNYCSSFLVLDCEDYKIELLEDYACNNRTQLVKKEGEYIIANQCCNISIAGRNRKEYQRQYYNDNIDEVKERQKQYRINNSDKERERHKQYRINNTDKIKEKKKQYYLKKKEYLNTLDTEEIPMT